MSTAKPAVWTRNAVEESPGRRERCGHGLRKRFPPGERCVPGLGVVTDLDPGARPSALRGQERSRVMEAPARTQGNGAGSIAELCRWARRSAVGSFILYSSQPVHAQPGPPLLHVRGAYPVSLDHDRLVHRFEVVFTRRHVAAGMVHRLRHGVAPE